MSNAYDEVLSKFNWANIHIENFQRILDAFKTNETNSHPFGIKRDAEVGTASYYVLSTPEIPVELRLIFGDALHSLRGTLDHLICKMVEAVGGRSVRQTKFPICDSASEYHAGFERRVPGVGKCAKECIDRIYPYKTGNPTLWVLHRLDIVNKHR